MLKRSMWSQKRRHVAYVVWNMVFVIGQLVLWSIFSEQKVYYANSSQLTSSYENYYIIPTSELCSVSFQFVPSSRIWRGSPQE